MPIVHKPLSIEFSNGLVAKAVYPASPEDISATLAQLKLKHPSPTMVIVGGASKISEADRERLRSLFVHVLAPLAESLNACVIDGGTDAGVMQMMGEARQKMGATFPLVGVAPVGLAVLPNQAATIEDASPLEPHHTHLLLIPGCQWGDESPWMAEVASQISQGLPSVTVLINGGEVTWKDAASSVDAKRSIVAIAGSGRTADILVAALQGTVTDDRALPILKSGLLQSVDLKDSHKLENVLKKIMTKISKRDPEIRLCN